MVFVLVYQWVLGVAAAVRLSCVWCFWASFMIQSVIAWHWFGLQFSGGARLGSSIMHL